MRRNPSNTHYILGSDFSVNYSNQYCKGVVPNCIFGFCRNSRRISDPTAFTSPAHRSEALSSLHALKSLSQKIQGKNIPAITRKRPIAARSDTIEQLPRSVVLPSMYIDVNLTIDVVVGFQVVPTRVAH